MPKLSGYARRALKRIAKGNRGTESRFHRSADGRYYLPNGKQITGDGLHELISLGVYRSAEDGLFPEHPQTFLFDGKTFAQCS